MFGMPLLPESNQAETMQEQDTHTMEQHLSDRLRDYEKGNRDLRAENLRLKTELNEYKQRYDPHPQPCPCAGCRVEEKNKAANPLD